MKRLLVCALLVGCGGDDSGGFIALDDLGLELGIAGCAKQWECCTDVELMEQYMGIEHDGEPITTEARCVEFANAILTGLAVAQFKGSLEQGRIEYDGAAAAGCVAAVEGVSCAAYSMQAIEAAPGCRPYLIPKVADGGGCTQDYECVSKYCEGESVPFGGPSTDGECKQIPTAGQACDEKCDDGLHCDYDQTAGMDICQPTKPDGEQCVLDDECTSAYCDDMTRICGTEPLTCDGR